MTSTRPMPSRCLLYELFDRLDLLDELRQFHPTPTDVRELLDGPDKKQQKQNEEQNIRNVSIL